MIFAFIIPQPKEEREIELFVASSARFQFEKLYKVISSRCSMFNWIKSLKVKRKERKKWVKKRKDGRWEMSVEAYKKSSFCCCLCFRLKCLLLDIFFLLFFSFNFNLNSPSSSLNDPSISRDKRTRYCAVEIEVVMYLYDTLL